MAPRILIPIPTSFDEPYNQQSWPEYAAAVRESGGEPVAMPLTHTPAEIERLVRASDGVLLPGSGADVSPELYGHERETASAEPDPLREGTDRAVFLTALSARTPLLGICLGMQSMNVFHGGTLVQDLSPIPVNHRAGRRVLSAHAVLLARDSRLGRVLATASDVSPDDSGLRLMVNSSHHQGAALPGDELLVTARCPEDGVLEAMEGADPSHWMIGVQWHPERTFAVSDASRRLFAAFVQAAEDHAD